MLLKVSDFQFYLPLSLIADYPAEVRTGSRLMHLDAATGLIQHYKFSDLPGLLNADDLLVFNNTRVIPARFFGAKGSGGKVEILLERVVDEFTALAQIRASKSPNPGGEIRIDGGPTLLVDSREGEFFVLVFPAPVMEIAEEYGHVPLPPYIERQDESIDQERYQTVYSSVVGAVAAPTAGLHFDDELLATLANKGVSREELTLHVGAGTFQPVRVDDIEDHQMHSEYLTVPKSVCTAVDDCRARSARVVAVGTTSVRSLETASASGVINPYEGDTDIFIYPGYEFRSVDAIVTNFHLPGSTLLMLVSAFAGVDNIRNAYQTAIEESYRFFSYGDAMLITR